MYYLIFVLLFVEKSVLISALRQNLNLPEGANCSYDIYNGTCVKHYRCMSALGIKGLKTTFPPNCNSHSEDAVVCCPDCKLVKDTRDAVYFRYAGIKFWKGTRAHDKCLEYLYALPYHCKDYSTVTAELFWHKEKKCKGKKFMAIAPTGGDDAERYEFPHMALLGYGDDLKSVQWLCGGSVISERFVLTAAHCISSSQFGNVSYIAVGMLKRSDPPEYWNHYKVKRIIPYPDYKSPSKYHDIALLETEKKINFSTAVLPACLDTADYVYEFPSDYLQATGWGDLGYGKPTADTLQTVFLEEFPDERCQELYPAYRHFEYGFDNITQMCYGSSSNMDTCQGDSGGPLQERVNMACQHDIRGVTSFGNPCGRDGGAGLYTRVQYYVPWIEDIVWPKKTIIDSRILDIFN